MFPLWFGHSSGLTPIPRPSRATAALVISRIFIADQTATTFRLPYMQNASICIPLFFLFFLKHLIKSGVRDWNVATPRDMWRLGEPVLARLTCGVGALGPVHVQLCRCLGFLMQAKHEARSPSLKGRTLLTSGLASR